MTTLGLTTVYYGEELGRRGGAWPDNRSDMPARGDEALRAFYKTLISTRRAHPALWRGTHRGLQTGSDVYAFARQDAASRDGVIVVVNRGRSPGKLSLEPLPEWGGREVVDVLGGGAVPRKERLEVEVGPRSAVILTARE
jgi:alpha-amylase